MRVGVRVRVTEAVPVSAWLYGRGRVCGRVSVCASVSACACLRVCGCTVEEALLFFKTSARTVCLVL